MSDHQILDQPEVLAALDALKKAIEASCVTGGGRLKRLTLIAHATNATAASVQGCGCLACTLATVLCFGQATGATITTDEVGTPAAAIH